MTASECLYLNNRVANFTSFISFLGGKYMRLWDPWLYTPLLEAVPAGAFLEKASDCLHRYVIEKNNTALARFPANGAVVAMAPNSLGLRLMSARFRARDFTRKVVNKLSRTLFSVEPIRQYYLIDFTHYLSRYNIDEVRNSLCHGDMILGGIVEVRRLITLPCPWGTAPPVIR